jgi:3-isopropylmalate dehydrogenase
LSLRKWPFCGFLCVLSALCVKSLSADSREEATENKPQTKRIAVIPGDGIGVEVTREAIKVLQSATASGVHRLAFTEFDWGAERYLRDGTTLPQGAVEMLRKEFDAILFGAVGDPRVPSNKHAADILLGLRAKLDLYVSFRPVELYDESLTPLRGRSPRDVNFVVLRENTEGLYAGVGGQFQRGTPHEVAVQEDVNTRRGVERIIRYAFEFARSGKLGRVCMTDKSNAIAFGHELWQRVFTEVRVEYPDIESRHLYVDTMAMELVRDPSQFRVIVTCNLFGDILSDLGAQLAGGLGLAPSGNIHPGQVSLFEPVHGSAPNLAGKNVANPSGSVLASALMLDHLGMAEPAERLREAVRAAVRAKQITADLGGSLGTRAAGDWLAARVQQRP